MGREKGGKKENHFKSSYNVWKAFLQSIHLSGFQVLTPGQKKVGKEADGEGKKKTNQGH